MDIGMLGKTVLFRGMSNKEIISALKELSAFEKTYLRDEAILHAGDTTDIMGLVLEGSVRIESNDIWGNRTILSHVGPGQVFAETYAMLEDETLLVDAVANQNCRVLMLDVSKLRSPAMVTAEWESQLISNILNLSMRKNLMLSGRSFHTSPKTIRGRVMSYLSSMSIQEGADEFDIPFDRQQLADYLNTERTALSKELAKMQRDGIISFRKNHFKVNY